VSRRAPSLDRGAALKLGECAKGGGVVLFPTDTVYGVGCDPECRTAVERLYQLKGRPPLRPAAVIFFTLSSALDELGELHDAERAAVEALLPGPATLLLPNRARRFPLACGPDPATVGVRVPCLEQPLAALAAVDLPLLQSSANLSGGADARRLGDVPARLRERCDLVLDGGELPGVASTVVDLRAYASSGAWGVLREGALGTAAVARALR
jgi:L-threonylcarbamoyladenylate synthase